MSGYTEKVVKNFTNPQNMGEITNPSGVGTVGSKQCGDIMRMFLTVEGDVITDAKFKTFGCGAAVASSSMATQMVIGKTVFEAMELTNMQVVEALEGLPPEKIHCSCLAEEALRAALWDYSQKSGVTIPGLSAPDDPADM
ncbi:MAG: iron-sulfur cluster assembly scaffold protein [Defluviitaleaceae bacterium]|nr:iron-sulfur cluster assembly scaffold protein [Defluviitaleaceae bacterium]